MMGAQATERRRQGAQRSAVNRKTADYLKASREVRHRITVLVRALCDIPIEDRQALLRHLETLRGTVRWIHPSNAMVYRCLRELPEHSDRFKCSRTARRKVERAAAKRLVQEIDAQPKPRVIPPGPDRPGYVKELVMKYKLRPIPYGAQLTGGYIRASGDVLKLFSNLRYEPKEHVITVHLNAGNQILSVNHVATGTMHSCPVNAGELFRDAILAGASNIVVVHNHPSGNSEPSAGDRAMMEQLRRVGELLDVSLLDFVVLGDQKHWSASDHGLLYQAGIQGFLPPSVSRRPAAVAVKGGRGKGRGNQVETGRRRRHLPEMLVAARANGGTKGGAA
jgi:DNA repair protein RadC